MGELECLCRIVKFKANEISPDSLLRKHKDKIGEDFELEL